MTFDEVLGQVLELLQHEKRVSYRGLQRRFSLDEAYLADLKEELLFAHPEIADVDGRGLVWNDEAARVAAPASAPAQSPAPASYTPPHLAARIRAEQAALEARGASDGERKTITALFADIQDSTALIEDLDPEAARRLIDPALQLMMDAVHRYEGFVVQPTGDGIFALFGAPLAHEDHPQRALFAALRMQEESKRYAEQLRREQGVNLQIRVGVNTGEVVLRSIRKDDLHTDYTPVGHSIHLAARMESLASGGAIVVSEGTYKLIEGYFECKILGEAKVKGVTEPVPIYEVLGVGPLRTRLQVSAVRRGLTRFVGRHTEMEQLRRALAQTNGGHGQIVGVMGEPGVGKSRLFYEFKLTSHSGCLVLEAYSFSYGKASPYLPLIELLKTYFQLQLHDEERQRKEKITGKVLTLDRSLEDTLPYLFSLLGIEDPTASLQQMDPQIRRRRTFEALKRLFLRESLNQPLLLIFEDLHWADPSTLEVVSLCIEQAPTARLLLLLTFRPDFHPPWAMLSHLTQLTLSRLGRSQVEGIVKRLIDGKALPAEVLQQIVSKTDGVPLFVEELTKTVLESGLLREGYGRYELTSPLPPLAIPTTLHDSLMARLDRLATVKEVAQRGAVLGREFSYEMLRAVAATTDAELQQALAKLVEAEVLYQRGLPSQAYYVFKHALIQEAAYQSLLKSSRQQYHQQIAQVLEERFPEAKETQPELLAHHYTEAALAEQAISYWQMSGERAAQRSAYVEAIAHCTKGLELLQLLPDTPARTQQELRLQLALGGPLRVTKGWVAPEVERVYTRALELCRQVGETPELFLRALLGLEMFYLLRAELKTAHELAEQGLSLAQNAHNPNFLMQAHYILGNILFFLGEFSQAQGHLEQGIALYDPQQHRSSGAQENPKVSCLSYAAYTLWFLGYADQARQRSHEALTLAQELSHPFSLAYALNFAAGLHQLRREWQATQERAEALVALSTEQGFPHFLAQGAIRRGCALAEQGRGEEGTSQIRQGLDAWQAMRAELAGPIYLAVLAEAYGRAGQVKEGLAVLAEALAMADRNGERNYEMELYQLRGELMLAQSRVQSRASSVQKEAEECFWKAIKIARQQQAKSLELRAVMSLSRLWQQQGKIEEARQLLAEVYSWFTEGFNTKDLQEAKTLLDELS